MYLYTPLDGRTVVVETYCISSTGMQFNEPIPCLEAVLGKLLTREGAEILPPLAIEPLTKPIIEAETVSL